MNRVFGKIIKSSQYTISYVRFCLIIVCCGKNLLIFAVSERRWSKIRLYERKINVLNTEHLLKMIEVH
jgi:hypothetical protein